MISIVILSYRNPALIRLCLKSLAQATQGQPDIEVIVVDNASTPETRAVVTEEYAHAFPSIMLVPIHGNAGYTRGVNEGIRVATGEYILSLNYDIVLEPGAIQALAAYLHDHPDVGLIGPRLVNFDTTHQDSCFRFYRPFTIFSRRIPMLPGADRERVRFAMRDSDHTAMTIVDWVSGAAFMTTRKTLNQVGLLDESLFHYFSDVDLAWRFWENGYSVVYYPTAAMYHYHGQTSRGRFGILDPLFNKATRWHITDGIRYFMKHGITGRRPHPLYDRQPQLITP